MALLVMLAAAGCGDGQVTPNRHDRGDASAATTGLSPPGSEAAAWRFKRGLQRAVRAASRDEAKSTEVDVTSFLRGVRWTHIDFLNDGATSAENARALAGLGIHVAHPPATPYGEFRVIASDHGRIRIATVLPAWSFVCAGRVTMRHPLLDILKTRLHTGRDYAVEVTAHYGDRSLGTFECLLGAGVPARIADRYAGADTQAHPGA